MAHVARAIQARGGACSLQLYSDNDAANALYERMGFALRRRVTFTVFAKQPANRLSRFRRSSEWPMGGAVHSPAISATPEHAGRMARLRRADQAARS